jgi:ABC-type molybdate transport system substrate-binding protein
MISRFMVASLLFTLGLAMQPAGAEEKAAGQEAAKSTYVAIPENKDHDLKLYMGDGRLVMGAEALGRMKQEAGLVLWLAGNQFFAMDDVIGTFQKQHPGIAVGLVTLPPGLIVKAIQAGGWRYGGKDYPGLPDIYASVNLGHLQTLKKSGLMDSYAVYMHNELQLITAQGNPKKIHTIADLARPDVRTSLPNPVNEGIMQFYLRKVLERYKLWDQIAAGKECSACQTTPNNWFTAVHHRETPERIRDGLSDVGVVWKTEVQEALKDGAAIDGVVLPPEDSLRDEVSYAIGVLSASPHRKAATDYLAYLATSAGQDAYARYGFVSASAEELKPRPIP